MLVEAKVVHKHRDAEGVAAIERRLIALVNYTEEGSS
jgi:hypothetical protein